MLCRGRGTSTTTFKLWMDLTLSCYNSLTFLNHNKYNLHFTVRCSQTNISFLDTNVTLWWGAITSVLYWKEKAGDTLLRFNSANPPALLQLIPYSQYRNKDFRTQANLLKLCLLERGYSRTILKKAYQRALGKTRSQLLYKNQKKTSINMARFITKFSRQHSQLREIMQKYWHLLLADPKITKHLAARPEATFCRVRSLQDDLVCSHFSNPNDLCSIRESNKCGACNLCQFIAGGKDFILPNEKPFKSKHFDNCETAGVVRPSMWERLFAP